MFNYNPYLPYQATAAQQALANLKLLPVHINFEQGIFLAQSKELNLCWEFHADLEHKDRLSMKLEGIKTHFTSVLENLLRINEAVVSEIEKLPDLDFSHTSDIQNRYETLQTLLTEQIQIVEEAQADLENCSTLFELEHSGDATHYKDIINSHCERGLAPEEFRPFARMIIDVCRAEDTEAAFPQFYQKLLAFQPTTATTFRM
jgi:predicted RNase H-like nuclease (RuvC/YqgF family)